MTDLSSLHVASSKLGAKENGVGLGELDDATHFGGPAPDEESRTQYGLLRFVELNSTVR